MGEMRFDGKVALVTGAGNGIGRQHARLLAARGCALVVNDLGGPSAGPNAAQEAVDEITAADGQAVADLHSVSDPGGRPELDDLTVEDVRDHLEDIEDLTDFTIPRSAADDHTIVRDVARATSV